MNETSQQSTESDNTPAETVSPRKETPLPPPKTSNLFANLLAVITILLVVGAGYVGYQQHLLMSERMLAVEQQRQASQSKYQELQQQLGMLLQQTRQQAQQRQAQYDADIKGLTDQLLATREKLTNLIGASEQSWHLDEAYYLLRIANNRLIFLADVETAVSLLQQADALLAKMDQPDLFLTRKKLAEDIQRLNAYPRLDRTGIAIRVGALQSKVQLLPMLLLTKTEEVVTIESAQQPQTWFEHLSASFKQLSGQWFDVRHHGSGYSPMISEQDEQQLRFAMMMTLQTIQFAILHSNNDLFQASLLQLKSRLNNYFDTEDSQVRAILLEIDQLLALQVMPQELSPLSSLAALNNYRAEQDKAPVVEQALPDSEQGVSET